MGGMGEGAVSRERGAGSGPPTTTPNGGVGWGPLPAPCSPLPHRSLTIQNLGLIVVESVPPAPSRNRIAGRPGILPPLPGCRTCCHRGRCWRR